MIQLTRDMILGWADSATLAEGSRLQSSGAVFSVQAQDPLLGGTVKLGASRIVVRMRIVPNGPPEHIKCPCSQGSTGRVCPHVVAVALEWAKRHAVDQSPESMVFAAEHAPTVLEVKKWAGPELFARAEAYLRHACVHDVQFKYPTGFARVQTGASALLPVTFTIPKSGLITGKCPCSVSRDRGMLCEHIIATALAVAQYYGSEERRKQYEAERAHATRLAHAKDLIQRRPNGTVSLSVCVILPDQLQKHFETGKIRAAVALLANGKTYAPDTLPKGICYRVTEGDETLLGILEEIAGGAFGTIIELSKEDVLSLCYCSRNSRVGTRTKRFQFLPKPIETPFLLEVDKSSDGLRLSLITPDRGLPLVAGHQGVWFDGEHISPLSHLLPEPLRILYQEAIVMPRAQCGAFFEHEWPLLCKALPIAEDAITPDLFTSTPGTPQFCIDLTGSEVAIVGQLRACYGNSWVTVGVPRVISEPDPDDFFHSYGRNEAAETEALQAVRRMGFTGRTGEDLGAIKGLHVVLDFLGQHVTEMKRWGWQVNLKGALRDLMEEAELIIPLVNIQPNEAKKSFEISISYRSPRGLVEVTPAEIERAIRNRRAFIERPSGPPILLDIGAVKTLRETIHSCHARAGQQPGSSCIDAVHAPFIQAALEKLEGIDFESTPDWHKRATAQNRKSTPTPVPLGPLENTLRPYQKEGVYWLRFLESSGFCGILADEMGLGKTLQTLTWLQLARCRETAQQLPALIIGPTSLVENWNREAEKFVPWMRRLVLSGPHRQDDFARVPTMDLVITSYALIRRDIEFHARCRYSVIVLDEAQAIKNQRTQNALAVKQLQADTRLVLSGTPIENGVSDLWSIMDFLMPRYLGDYEDFKVRYEDRMELGQADAIAAQQQLRAKLHPFLLRRIKKDVAKDLPDKIRTVTYCSLTPDQRKAYEDVRAMVREKMRGLVKEKGFDKAKFEVLALLMKLRQICCHLHLVKDHTPKADEQPSAKLEALMEILREAQAGGHRVLIFSQFTSMLKMIARRFEEDSIQYCYLDGETKNRVEICAKFNQTPQITAFLISLKAGGTGLNLTGADMVVHFDPWWNPAAEEQATDRAHRIGQKKTVQAIKLIAQDTIEEKVLEMQEKKQALIDATVNASDASIVSTLTMAEIEALLS